MSDAHKIITAGFVEMIADRLSKVENMGDLLTTLIDVEAKIIAITSSDESRLLDGIKLVNDGLRSCAAEYFAQLQKIQQGGGKGRGGK